MFGARQAFDDALDKKRTSNGSDVDVDNARTKLTDAKKKLADERANLASVDAKSGMPLPTRVEAALAVARAELTAAELGVEKTRVRAPFDGTVLNIVAKEGEIAAPSPENTLLVFGDLSTLKVRAEVEERDAAKIHVGQRVVVRADAYPDQDFEGRVGSIAQSLSQPRIVSRGPRRPNDVEVLEALVDLDGAAAAADRHARRRVLQARRHRLDEVSGRAHRAALEFEAGASSPCARFLGFGAALIPSLLFRERGCLRRSSIAARRDVIR